MFTPEGAARLNHLMPHMWHTVILRNSVYFILICF
jgi:hypothetical protein